MVSLSPVRIILTLLFVSVHGKFMTVCIFDSLAKARPNRSVNMDVADIEPSLCTHLVWWSADIDVPNLRIKAREQGENSREGFKGRFEQFTDLKKQYERLKTLISVGGEATGSDLFLAVTKDASTMHTFARNVVRFLKVRDFDGLVVDWQYPSKSSGSDAMFVKLLKALKLAFKSNGTNLILATTMASASWLIDESYEIKHVYPHVDFLLLLTFEYNMIQSHVAAFNSPLFSRPNSDPSLSVSWTVDRYILEGGVPPPKVVVGLSFMGNRYVLANPLRFTPGSPVRRDLRAGDLYSMPAKLAYPEICGMMKQPGAIRYYDSQQEAPYLVYEDNFVGYDDARSITLKMKWLTEAGVGGVSVWTLDMDDYTGELCDQGKNPLLKTINHVKVEVGLGLGSGTDAVVINGGQSRATVLISIELFLYYCLA